VALKPIL